MWHSLLALHSDFTHWCEKKKRGSGAGLFYQSCTPTVLFATVLLLCRRTQIQQKKKYVLYKKGTPNQIGNVSRTSSLWCPHCIKPLYVTGWHPVSCCPGDAPRFQHIGTGPRDLWPTLGANFNTFQHKGSLSSRRMCIINDLALGSRL